MLTLLVDVMYAVVNSSFPVSSCTSIRGNQHNMHHWTVNLVFDGRRSSVDGAVCYGMEKWSLPANKEEHCSSTITRETMRKSCVSPHINHNTDSQWQRPPVCEVCVVCNVMVAEGFSFEKEKLCLQEMHHKPCVTNTCIYC